MSRIRTRALRRTAPRRRDENPGRKLPYKCDARSLTNTKMAINRFLFVLEGWSKNETCSEFYALSNGASRYSEECFAEELWRK
jgi:hypothetical protein